MIHEPDFLKWTQHIAGILRPHRIYRKMFVFSTVSKCNPQFWFTVALQTIH